MATRFYWSDLHHEHDLVAKERNFSSTDEHDAHWMDRWAAKVGKNDSIWILGDLAMRNPSRVLEVIRYLPGAEKHLIAGNHDNCHPMHRDAHRHQKRYLDVFDSVQTFARHRIAGNDFALSHFPFEGDGPGRPDRHAQWRLRNEGNWVIHGHVHNAWTIKDRQINVGVDRWMDGPVSEDEIAGLYLGHLEALVA